MRELMLIAANTERADELSANSERTWLLDEMPPGDLTSCSGVAEGDKSDEARSSMSTPNTTSESTLAALLQTKVRVHLGKKLRPTQLDDNIVTDLRAALPKLGSFHRTEQGLALFFRYANRNLYEISDKAESPFGQLVTYWLDVSSKFSS